LINLSAAHLYANSLFTGNLKSTLSRIYYGY